MRQEFYSNSSAMFHRITKLMGEAKKERPAEAADENV